MTNKEIVQDLLRRIPDDASLQDIARELEFIAAVRQGLSELDNGDSVSIEEVEKELPSWISSKTLTVRTILTVSKTKQVTQESHLLNKSQTLVLSTSSSPTAL